ncbi:S8 family serine peptidase [Paraburkholderia sp. RL17-337-BIB-A]|uniref:S8 family serine peptidase n=1 Tax=Paraburkholderia sp. RL17-337-BIB-A TaxID=3031636 RepID=UPI0038B9D8C3
MIKVPAGLQYETACAANNQCTENGLCRPSLAMSMKMNTSSLAADASVDRFIVKYKTGTPERRSTSSVQARLDKLGSAFPSKARHLRRLGLGSDVVKTDRALNAIEAKAFMRAIASDPDVEFVEPDAVMNTGSAPNDPLYAKQWALSSNKTPGTTTAGIRAEGAWETANGAGVVIGVVDSGITSHSDLNANVLPGYEFTGGTCSNRGGDGTQPANKPGENCNVMWHGTHVAGIMAAVTNNSIGIAGIAPAAKIVSVRTVRNCDGGYMSDMADGITWAAGGTVPDAPVNSNPAKVINISLYGWGACQTPLQDAIDYATSKGTVVVVIAGNYSTDASKVQPANCRNVITVGAINSDSTKWVSSDFGPTVDIAAPGNNIWSTYNDGKTAPGAEGYGLLGGTSQAAPMVSGVAALVQSIAPKPLTVAEVRTLIQQTAQSFMPQRPDQPIGPGIVDATAAVQAAKSGKIPAAADFTCTQSPNLMQLTCKDLSTARGGVPIRSWSWNFGDGKPDTIVTRSTNPVVDYDFPGTYQITLTTTDGNGAVSTTSLPVHVEALLVTDLGGDYVTQYGLRFALAKDEVQYFSIDVPQGPRSLHVNSIWTTTFNLKSASSKDVATLELKGGTASMVSPDCTSSVTGGVAATCVGYKVAGGQTWYARVTGKTAVADATIRAFNTEPDTSGGFCGPGSKPC